MQNTMGGMSNMMFPSYFTYSIHYYRAHINIPIEAFEKKECYVTLNVYENESDCWADSDASEVTSCYLCSDHMRKHQSQLPSKQTT